MSDHGVNTSRRTFLIGATTGVAVVGAGAAAVPFVQSWQPSARAENAGAPVKVDVSQLSPGERVTANWRGRPVWVLRRTESMLDSLDQVRALEREMRARIYEQGLDIAPQIRVLTRLIPEAEGTTCDQPREHILHTENAQIVRVPFRSESGEVVPHWVSRFRVWPYLEAFTAEAEKELLADLGARPDLIIGNYSDGNLVATLLAQRLHVTQCNIAHALEKTKYLYSDLYWQENEPSYHFSCQFTADLIAMNAADFIITSTYQEIAGDRKSVV